MRKVKDFICVALLLISSSVIGAELSKPRLKASNPAGWKPVPYKLDVPTCGVTLDEAGLFKPVMDENITYLLNSFSVDHMLFPFRQRAGQKNPPSDTPQVPGWDTKLRGSNAGRFLMGAGNTLRWFEHAELRKRFNELIDGIEECGEPDGYIAAHPRDGAVSQEPNYARAWFTHGLIEAAIVGNPKAYGLLRGHTDWFNKWDRLPELLYCAAHNHQGHIACTRTYFTPIGKPEDLQVAEKYYVCDWWLEQLAARDKEGVWKYPLDRPHCYEITSFEAYLDHYLATGDKTYLDAMLGAWELIYENWLHLGGSLAICEHGLYPPKSYYLTQANPTGELCGSVFWIKFNQRFHRLYPEQEKYTTEIERSIYNVGIPSMVDGRKVRYHSAMQGLQYDVRCCNTCCEGQGTRLYGSLPEYIYSIAPDGLYVNLFEPSSIKWRHNDQPVTLEMATKFPYEPQVSLQLATKKPVKVVIHVRVPSWAAADVPLAVNGQQVAVGKPGTYQAIDRTWADGDTISFTLPMNFRVTPYVGKDQIAGHNRYAIEYGPLLMAIKGPLDKNDATTISHCPEDIKSWLKPKASQPLCFTIDGNTTHTYMPYLLIRDDETFCVYPIIEPGGKK